MLDPKAVETARQALKTAIRDRYITALPALVQEWEDSVRLSEDPKHYKDFIAHITEVLELRPRPDARSDLPTLHINILDSSGTPLVELESIPARPARSTDDAEDVEWTPFDASRPPKVVPALAGGVLEDMEAAEALEALSDDVFEQVDD